MMTSPLKRRSALFVLSFLLLLFAAKYSFAQKTYGFEWIRPYQPYYKIKIVNKGLYRLDSIALQAWAGKDPRKFQLFKNGAEQALFIQGDADGVLNAGDYVEFLGEPNDGSLDAELYRNPSEQAQKFRSIFSDTSVYFLTIQPDTALQAPLRMLAYTDNDYGNYSPEPNFSVVQQIVPQEDYYYGLFLPSDPKYYLSEYGDAEGMMSMLIGQSQSRTFTFQTPAAAAQNAQFEIKIIGASDFFLANPALANHHIRVSVIANNGTPQSIIDTTFRGYGERKFTRSLSASLLGDSTRFVVEVINDISVGSDFIGVSYLQLAYTKTAQSTFATEDLLLNNPINAAKTYLLLNGFSGAEPIIWDLKTMRRAVGAKSGFQAKMLLPYTTLSRRLIIQNAGISIGAAQLIPVNFVVPQIQSNYEYLIVSNRQLTSVATEYQAYRSQRYNTYLAYAEDLSDYYFFGNFHPLAIRRFCEHLYNKQSTPPQFLLLLGRGYQNNLLKADVNNNVLNLVPAIGVPSSDHLFTNGFVQNTGAPAIATGRIPAANVQEANNYLQKLKYLETQPDSIQKWRKHFLHLSGGSYESQQNDFRNKLKTIGAYVEDKPNGSHLFAYGKSSTASTENNQATKEKLVAHLNDGVNMLTFYGHGSLTVLDMDFGDIDDLQPNHRLAFYYFNGCNIGNANDVDPLGSGQVYGKDYICAANKGAIGWLAHTNLTFTGQLDAQMDQFYRQLSMDGYQKPIGLQLKKALENTASTNEPFARSHALQILLQGDPAFVLYAPSKPDYKIANTDLFISPPNASVQNDSLAIGIIIHNLALAQTDTLSIDVSRTLPDNTTLNYATLKVNGPYYQDTMYYWIKPLLKKDIGLNTFKVSLNKLRKIEEQNYLNNEAQLDYFLPGSGIQAVLPYPYAIVAGDSVSLWIQNNNIFAEPTSYIFEIDTGLQFLSNSPYFMSSGVVNAGAIASFDFPLKGGDSMVYYWRAKLNLPENEGGVWTTQSFVNLKNGPDGWHQKRYEQVRNVSSKNTITFNDSLKHMEFSEVELVLGIENKRWDHRGMGVIIPYLLNAGVGTCIGQGTVVLVFEPFQVDFPYELPNYPFNCAFVQANKHDQSVRYYPFNTNTTAGEAELQALIDSVPNGYYVAMFSRYSSNLPNWSANTKAIFSKIGSVKVPQVLSTNTAWAVIGKKGEALGLASEDTVINNELEYAPNLPPLPTDPQDIKKLSIRRAIRQKWYTGSITSAPIGPARQYGNFHLLLRDEDPIPSGRYWYDIIGVKTNGSDTVLLKDQSALLLNLSAIDAKQYPFLKCKLSFVDSTYRSPQQIDFWQVDFVPGPELTVNANSSYLFHADLLEQGDSLVLQMPVLNLGANYTDSSKALIEITDANRLVPYRDTLLLPPIASKGQYLLKTRIDSKKLFGSNQLQLSVNALKQPAENNYVNNFYKKNFVVQTDNKNPLLEVTFDGQRIMNGDIVSPNPIIRMSSTDQNKFMFQNDTSTFELYLRKPKEDFERINLNDPRVQFIPADKENEAQLVYTPAKFADGLYSLKVQAKDASGNAAGSREFQVDFNVVNKSSITYFYPYPNPFTTQMRFVFTLTGSKVPDQLLIRIMTINGKVVREIRKEEFGEIHIGNNISEFAWDGTDMYGDKLANGVYLYTVYTRIEGEDIENRATKAKEESAFFVNGTGKIYLMR